MALKQEDNTPEEVINGDGSERKGTRIRPKAAQESPSPVLAYAKESEDEDEQNQSLYKDSDRNSPSPKRSPI